MNAIKLLCAFFVVFSFSACNTEKAAETTPKKEILTFADLEGKKIGVKTGTKLDVMVSERVKNAEIKYFMNNADVYLALTSGAVDGISLDYPIVKPWQKRNNKIRILDERIDYDNYGMALQKDSPLTPILDSMLNVLIGEGKLDELSKKWIDDGDNAEVLKQDWPGNAGTWNVATEGNDPPFDYFRDNELVGYCIDLILSIAKRLDKKVEFKTMDFASLIPALESGKADISTASLSITEERKKKVDFSVPIFKSENIIAVMEKGDDVPKSTKQLETFADLEGKKIGVKTGTKLDVMVSERVKNAEIKYFMNNADVYLALTSGAVDGISLDYPIVKPWQKRNNKIRILDERIDYDNYGIALQKNSPLTPILDSMLNVFTKEGKLDELSKKWIDDGDNAEVPKQDWPGNAGTWNVATEGNDPPFDYYRDNELVGYCIDLILSIAKRLDKKVVFKTMDFMALIPELESGKADMSTASLSITEERKKKVDFSVPIFKSENIIAVMEKDEDAPKLTKQLETFADLEGKKIGVKTGTKLDVMVSERVKNAEIKYFMNNADVYLALTSGAVDGISLDYPIVKPWQKRNSKIRILDERIDYDNYGMALQKNSPLTPVLDSMLNVLIGEGKLDELSKKWIDDGDNAEVPKQDWPGASGTWVVATEGNDPPFDYFKDNELVGYCIDLMLSIAKRLDKKVVFKTMDFMSLIPALESGKVDISTASLSITEERKQKVDFSVPIFKSENIIAVMEKYDDASKSTKQLETFADLEGKKIGVKLGSMHDVLVSNKIKTAEKMYFPSAPDLFVALKSGNVDAIAYDEPVAMPWLKRDSALYMKLDEVLDVDSYGIALPKNSPITAKVDSALQLVMEEGLLKKYLDKWFNYDENTELIPMDWEAANGTLVAATNGSLPPFCFYKNNKLAGFEIDLMLAIAQKLGMHVKFITMDFSGILPALASQKVDLAITGISITEERKKMIDYTRPYYQNSAIVVVRRESGFDSKENGVEGAKEGLEEGFIEGLKASIHRTFILEQRWKMVLDGLYITVIISVFSGIFGILLGFAICMVRRSKKRSLAISSACFIRAIQGMPVLVFLMILYYIVFGHSSVSGEVVSIIAFSINFGVYASEIIRSGMDSVDVGQLEASYALGYSGRQTFFKILLPQAALRFIPVLKGEFINMVKMTSVVGYVAVMDLTKVSDIIRSRTMEAFFPLIATAVAYFIIASAMTSILSYCERKANPKSRARKVKGVK